MERCSVCNGRTIKTSSGFRCMNNRCEGAKENVQSNGIICEDCGDPMDYRDLDTYGRPNYVCMACGITTTL